MSLAGNTLFAILLIYNPTQKAVAAGPTVVSETMGQVGEYVVTSREVRISRMIEGVLYPTAKKGEITVQELTGSVADASFQSALTGILLENVVAFEAVAFNLGDAAEEDVKEALQKVEGSASYKSAVGRLDIEPEELKRFIKRKIVAKNFLKFKTNSMVGLITDGEVKAYYDGNRSKFSGDSFAAYKENIRTYLMQQQLEERLRSWFEVIQRKYKVRNFLADKPV